MSSISTAMLTLSTDLIKVGEFFKIKNRSNNPFFISMYPYTCAQTRLVTAVLTLLIHCIGSYDITFICVSLVLSLSDRVLNYGVTCCNCIIVKKLSTKFFEMFKQICFQLK